MTQIAAIFDLDETLLDASSGRLFYQYLRHSGQFFRFFRLRDSWTVVSAVLLYRLGLLDATETMQRGASVAAGLRLDDFWPVVQQWFDEVVVRHIAPAAQERLAWHRIQGHIPIICSGSSQFSVVPVARHLQIEHFICTEWLCNETCMTGAIRQPIAYGDGKVHWMQQWAATHNVNLAASYFYTDHISDLPLLEAVAHPNAVNPERHLAQVAAVRGWPILQWR